MTARLDDAGELNRWVRLAGEGQVCEWWRGDLERDRVRLPELDRLARRVGHFVRSGELRVLTIEVRTGVWVYRCTRTAVAVALAEGEQDAA